MNTTSGLVVKLFLTVDLAVLVHFPLEADDIETLLLCFSKLKGTVSREFCS